MHAANPVYIARNHRVEEALAAAIGPAADLKPLHRLLEVLRSPYDERAEFFDYTTPAPDGGRGYQTFCGT